MKNKKHIYYNLFLHYMIKNDLRNHLKVRGEKNYGLQEGRR